MKFEGYGPKWNRCEFCGVKLDLPRKPKLGDRMRHSEQTIDKHDWILRHKFKQADLRIKRLVRQVNSD